MKEFFPEESVRNKEADRPWMKSDTDKMLDLYLEGMPPDRIAIQMKRTPKAIERRIQQFVYNEDGRAERYAPLQRVSRVGKRITQNETLLFLQHRKNNVSSKVTALVLARKVEELQVKEPTEHKQRVKQLKPFVPTLDMIMAFRYWYHRYKEKRHLCPPDKEYDDLVEEEIEFGGGSKVIAEMRRNEPHQCPSRIKSLALYLVQLAEDSQ